MQRIKIVTDSSVDLREEILNKYEITSVPLTIFIDGESYLDAVDISPDEFLERMKQAKELPKSSQPPVGRFLEVYDELGKDGSKVLSIHMTGKMSGTVRSAEQAAEMSQSDVTVVDSGYISKALSFQVIEAAKMAEQGEAMEDIVTKLQEIRSQTKLYIVVDTLENLIKGGRIGKAKGFIGSLLNIKPIANLDTGELSPVTKVRSHAQVIKFLSTQIAEEVKGKKLVKIGLVHAGGYELASRLREKLIEVTGVEEIDIETTTPIISTHAGPGALGIMYWAK
ncbi:DegV family EDD domain-containing protein [Bacillus aerolatus]|uniref:DegV family EDD domain-containing protein n=1 Tax=Bacillus aerolatus TaxID=2653354 RepID=A0A6I1FQK2_9BACI|nr:DegV family protein [Bacillus aerolatus]KAB7708992.1 DegV family EDD domain-containing protein [Bacillus aerolatus]